MYYTYTLNSVHAYVVFLQLKNLIAALYSSRCDGSNKFEKDGILFGWKPIEDMLHKEVQRKNYQLPRVSGLKENFVYRDPWTRLNVNPAKVHTLLHFMERKISIYMYIYVICYLIFSKTMYVISELEEHVSGLPPSDEAYAQSIKMTVAYLKTFNKLFERGILGKGAFIKDTTASCPILTNMEEGFGFFL